jgi:hypothetical protein
MKRFLPTIVCWRVALLILGLAFPSVRLLGADSDFYRQFTNAVGTNSVTNSVWIESSNLVDKSNNRWKCQLTTNELRALWEQGDICGLHLEMTMSEVIAKWSKPISLVWAGEQSCLFYAGVQLWFHGDSLRCVMLVCQGCAPDEEGVLRPFKRQFFGTSNPKDLAAVLGPPVHESNDYGEYYVFEKPERVITVKLTPKAETLWLSVQQRKNGLRFP